VRRIIPFLETRAEDAIGGKAKNLALLFQFQFPVPNAFIITAHAFELVIQKDQDPNRWVFPVLLGNMKRFFMLPQLTY